MTKISIYYDNSLVKNKKLFNNTIDTLKLKYKDSIFINESSNVKFQIIFNERIIYSLDDHFGNESIIDDELINKIDSYIDNSISLNKSQNISAVDDIGIDDF